MSAVCMVEVLITIICYLNLGGGEVRSPWQREVKSHYPYPLHLSRWSVSVGE